MGVGMLIFTQYWYWFPLAHFLSLAFTPSCVIGLNENLDMPVMGIKSNAKPSTYGYPPNLEEKKKEDKEKVSTAVLSITNKQKKEEKADEPEPNFELLSNPARVMKAQLKVVSLEDGKYRPMKDISIGGIIMLDRSKEIGVDEKEEIVEPILVNRGGASSDDSEEEPAPPEPFEYKED